MKHLLLSLSAMAFGLALSPLQAEKLDTRLISADASWVVHLDADQFIKGDLGRMIQDELKGGKHALEMDKWGAFLQMDFREDLSSVTMFGSGAEDEAIIVAKTKVSVDHLTKVLKLNPDYKAHMHGDVTIHEWVDGETKYGAILPGSEVILAPKKEFVSNVIDQLAGKIEGLPADSLLAQQLPSTESAFFVAAVDMEDLPDLGPEAEVLKDAVSGSLSITETDTHLVAELTLMIDTEENASNLSKMAQGLLAFGALIGEEEPELAELAKAASIEQEGRQLSGSLTLPIGDIVEGLNTHLGLNLEQ